MISLISLPPYLSYKDAMALVEEVVLRAGPDIFEARGEVTK